MIEEILYVYISAHLDHPDGAVVHLYQSDPWSEAGDPDARIVGRAIEGWLETLAFAPDEPGKPDDIADVDRLLTATGYRRLTDWTSRTGRSGRTVHTADGHIRIEDIR